MKPIDTDQVQRFLDRHPEEVRTEPGDSEPQIPFATSYKLTREQEDALVEHALNRVKQLEQEMGRTTHVKVAAQTTPPQIDKHSHFGKREIFTARYYNHVEDRNQKGTIFEVSNLTASLSQRITMQMIARANNYNFGTDPWFSAYFIGTQNKPLAERIDRHARWKMDQIDLKHTLMEAVEFAFVRGEGVVKTTYLVKEQLFRKRGFALVNAKGEAIADSTGNPIFQGAPQVVVPQTGKTYLKRETLGVADEQRGAEQTVPNPDAVELPPAGAQVWKEDLWPMRQKISQGPDSALVYYKDFLCPLTAKDVQTADLICHLYDLPVMEIAEMFQREDLAKMGAKDGLAAMRKAVDAIRDMAGSSPEPIAEANKPRRDFGEVDNAVSPNSVLTEVCECYLTYDADNDGIQEEIMLVLDRKNRRPIFYDYLANVTVKGRRPFEVVRPKSVDGRWYGMGSMEYFEPEQEFCDLLVNRRNFAMSKAGRVTFWNPSATREGQSNPHLKLNDGATYTLVDGRKAEEALTYVELPADLTDMVSLLEFFMQLMQLKSGVIHAGDQEMGGLPQSKLATGIRNIEKSGQEMFAQFLNALEPGLEAALLAAIRVLYANLNAPEIYRYSKGNTQGLDTITPDIVRDLDMDVSILMTRTHSEQMLSSGTQAYNILKDFYLQLPPQVQSIMAPIVVDIVKALSYDNAEEYVKPLAQPLPPPGAPGGALMPNSGPVQDPGMGGGPVSPSGPTDAASNLATPGPGSASVKPEQSPANI